MAKLCRTETHSTEEKVLTFKKMTLFWGFDTCTHTSVKNNILQIANI